MGIYRRGKIFWMSKTINGILYRKSTETESKMRARAIYEEWINQLKEVVLTGKPVIAAVKTEAVQVMTFNELAEKYLEFTCGRQKSYDVKKYIIPKFKEAFNDIPLSEFSYSIIENYQGTMIKKDYKPAYINKNLAILKHIFTKALDWELIDEAAYKKIIKVKQLKGENKRLRYLSEEESERLISNCEPYLKPIVITALNTGMRKSEIFKLTWDRLDLKNQIILLDRTKNGERREIPINDTLCNTLSDLTRHLKCDYVFYNPKTLKPFDKLKESWARALKKSHIMDFHFHDLRHTFASRLVMKGVDLTTVKELLGHKDIKMTLRYAHLAPAHIRKAVNMLDDKSGHIDLKIHNSFTIGSNEKLSNL